MEDKRILIAYGTHYGATEEISKEIAKKQKEKGFQTQIFNLGVGKAKDWPSLDHIDGLILGTSMKVNAWKKQVKSFLDRHKTNFKIKKLGLFTCGAYAIAEPEKAREDIANRLMKRFELKADIHEAFGGVLDFSEDSKLGRSGRLALKLAAMGISKETGFEFNMDGCNDFRDWDKIRSFADAFAEILNEVNKND